MFVIAIISGLRTSASETATGWNHETEAVQQRLRAAGGPGVARPEQVQGKTGLQLRQAVLAGELPSAHIAETLDFALIEVARGRALFQGMPQRKHDSPLGTVHGGWYATLLDPALGCAVHTVLDAGQRDTTAELGIHLVRAASLKGGPLRAIGPVVHAGRKRATAEARIVGAGGKLYAHGSARCLVLEPGG